MRELAGMTSTWTHSLQFHVTDNPGIMDAGPVVNETKQETRCSRPQLALYGTSGTVAPPVADRLESNKSFIQHLSRRPLADVCVNTVVVSTLWLCQSPLHVCLSTGMLTCHTYKTSINLLGTTNVTWQKDCVLWRCTHAVGTLVACAFCWRYFNITFPHAIHLVKIVRSYISIRLHFLVFLCAWSYYKITVKQYLLYSHNLAWRLEMLLRCLRAIEVYSKAKYHGYTYQWHNCLQRCYYYVLVSTLLLLCITIYWLSVADNDDDDNVDDVWPTHMIGEERWCRMGNRLLKWNRTRTRTKGGKEIQL